MQRIYESYQSHAQILQKFQNVFPNLTLPPIHSNISIFDTLNDIIRNIPKPSRKDTLQTICNMKNYVDSQELRIQMNMIEIEEAEPIPLHLIPKKYSIETKLQQDDSSEEHPVENMENWGWPSNNGLEYREEHELSSYLD